MNIPLDTAKQQIIEALNDFDRDLGRRAAEILYHDERANIKPPAEPPNNMMCCRPAGIAMDDLQRNDMLIDDFAERFGPHFTDQTNEADYAIIDFEYHGTPHSLRYLAHELGHCIADDMQREQGRSFRHFTPDQMEQQAYFVQNIVTHALDKQEKNDLPAGSRFAEYPLTQSFERVCQKEMADAAFAQACNMDPGQRRAFIADKLAGTEDRNTGHENMAPAISSKNAL